MQLLLKALFYALAGINGLIGLFYLVMTVFSLFFPPAPHYRSMGGFFFALGCAGVVCLLGWAYHLTILQGRTAAGFGMLTISYLMWIPALFALLFFGKGSWQ